MIISTITQVIVNLLNFNMPLREAIYAPRMFSIFTQRELEVENRVTEKSLALLESLRHDVKRSEAFRAYFGPAQSIMYDAVTNKLVGCSDPRRSGAAVGE